MWLQKIYVEKSAEVVVVMKVGESQKGAKDRTIQSVNLKCMFNETSRQDIGELNVIRK